MKQTILMTLAAAVLSCTACTTNLTGEEKKMGIMSLHIRIIIFLVQK